MEKNNINEVKTAIRGLIAERNRQYEATGMMSESLLEISRDEFRKVDRMCTINGKRTWLSKTVIGEMVESGELTVTNGFYAAGRGKRYRLNSCKPKTSWTSDMDFMSGCDCHESNTTDHREWLCKFYDQAELQKLDREWKARARVNVVKSAACDSNNYIYEGEDWRRYYYAARRQA